jgi:hypothetical protein
MRIRTIKPEWLEDDKLLQCSDSARLLTVALITVADDSGRGRVGLSTAVRIWPTEPDKLDRFIAELDGWFVQVYAVRDQRYFQIKNWSKHQRINRPTESKIPGPDVPINGNSVKVHRKIKSRSSQPQESSDPKLADSVRERNGREGKGRDRIKERDHGRGVRGEPGNLETCDPVQVVFAEWRKLHGSSKSHFNRKRQSRIKARLDEGYSPDQLCSAIRGTLRDPWLMGRDPKTNGRSWRGLDTILRDGEQVERLIALDAVRPSQLPGPAPLPDPAEYTETPLEGFEL